jgi:hypothetical protein
VSLVTFGVSALFSAPAFACFTNGCKQDCSSGKVCIDYVIYCNCGGRLNDAQAAELKKIYGTDVQTVESDDGQHQWVVDTQGNFLDTIK